MLWLHPPDLWLLFSVIQLRAEKHLCQSVCLFLNISLNGLMWKHAAGQRCMLGLFGHLGMDCARARGRARWVHTERVRERQKERESDGCGRKYMGVQWLISNRGVCVCVCARLYSKQRCKNVNDVWICMCVCVVNRTRRFSFFVWKTSHTHKVTQCRQ